MTEHEPTTVPAPVQTTGIFRRKPITDDGAEGGLERTIGLWQLTAIGLGAIIGAGIFALAGPVARSDAGPAVSVSFLIAGVASACAAPVLCGVRRTDSPGRFGVHLWLRGAG